MSALTPEIVAPLLTQELQRKCGNLAYGEVAKQCVDAGYSKDEVLRVLKPLWESRFGMTKAKES